MSRRDTRADVLLAVDTSTRFAGVAVARGEEPGISVAWTSKRNHTVELAPAVEFALRHAGVSVGDITAAAVAIGPGGFSALRAGMAFAKALAEARDVPLIGVSTLACEAFPHVGLGLPVCALLPMGREEVAAALFHAGEDGLPAPDGEPMLTTVDALGRDASGRTLFCGEAAAELSGALREALGERAVVQAAYGPGVRLLGLVAMARSRLSRGETDDRATLQPAYLRRPTITPSRRFIPGVTPGTPQRARPKEA